MDDTSKKPQTFRALAAELKLPRKLLYTLDEVSRVLGVPYTTPFETNAPRAGSPTACPTAAAAATWCAPSGSTSGSRREPMSEILLLLSDRVSAWWGTLSERTQSVVCAVVMLALFAIAGAIEGTTPSGMYY